MRDAIVYVHDYDYDDQVAECRAYCSLYDMQVVEVTRERAHAIAEARRRDAVLVTTSVTNLGDSLSELARTIDVVAVACIEQSIDSTSALGRLVLHVIASVEEYYRDAARNEADRIIDELRAQGMTNHEIAQHLREKINANQ